MLLNKKMKTAYFFITLSFLLQYGYGNMINCFDCDPTLENCKNINITHTPTIECGEFTETEIGAKLKLKEKQLNVFEIRTDDKSYFNYQCYSFYLKKNQTSKYKHGEYKGCYKLRAPFKDVCDAIKSDLGEEISVGNLHCKSCNTDNCNTHNAKPIPPLECYKCSANSPGGCKNLAEANVTTCNRNINNGGPISQCYTFNVYNEIEGIDAGVYRGCYPIGENDENVCETMMNQFDVKDRRFIKCSHCNHKKCNRHNSSENEKSLLKHRKQDFSFIGMILLYYFVIFFIALIILISIFMACSTYKCTTFSKKNFAEDSSQDIFSYEREV